MALTLKQFRKLLDNEGLKYFLDPDRDIVLIPCGGINGHYMIAAPLELDGRFLQFRTLHYMKCPADSPHLTEVLKVLGALNYQLRLTKFGWDAKDGEIVGYADVWLEDGDLTAKQLHRMLGCFLPALDLNQPRISDTIATGKDPGKVRPEDDPKVKSVLAKLRDKLSDEDDDKDGDGPDFGVV